MERTGKKGFLIGLMAAVLLVWASPSLCASTPEGYALPFYWVMGKVTSSDAPVKDRMVIFYKNDLNQNTSVGTNDQGSFEVNVFDLYYKFGIPITFETENYQITVPRTPSNDWGTLEAIKLPTVEGYLLKNLALVPGGGVLVISGEVAGNIFDQRTGKLVTSPATVTLTREGMSFSSSTSTGTYEVSWVPEGVYDAICLAKGYFPTQESGITVEAGKVAHKDFYLLSSRKILKLTCFLQGYYNNGTQRTATVEVELRSGDSPSQALTIVASTEITLDSSGQGEGEVEVTGGDYYLVIKHKLAGEPAGPNHLPIITKDKISFASQVVEVNVSDSNNKNYHQPYTPDGKPDAMWGEGGGKYCLRGGDMDGDGYVTASGDFPIWLNANGSYPGYQGNAKWDVRADIDGDGYVTANGDFPIWLNNNGYESYVPKSKL